METMPQDPHILMPWPKRTTVLVLCKLRCVPECVAQVPSTHQGTAGYRLSLLLSTDQGGGEEVMTGPSEAGGIPGSRSEPKFRGRHLHSAAQRCQNSVCSPRSDISPPPLDCTAHLNPVQAINAPVMHHPSPPLVFPRARMRPIPGQTRELYQNRRRCGRFRKGRRTENSHMSYSYGMEFISMKLSCTPA